MGARGPVPKRLDKRHGHLSRVQREIVTRVHGAALKAPALGFDAHPLAADWFAALSNGTEAQFYTPALWQRARIVAVMLSKLLESGRPSSQMYSALQGDMKAVGGRRRAAASGRRAVNAAHDLLAAQRCPLLTQVSAS